MLTCLLPALGWRGLHPFYGPASHASLVGIAVNNTAALGGIPISRAAVIAAGDAITPNCLDWLFVGTKGQ